MKKCICLLLACLMLVSAWGCAGESAQPQPPTQPATQPPTQTQTEPPTQPQPSYSPADLVLQFMDARGDALVQDYALAVGRETQPLSLTHMMEYQVEDLEGYALHCVLFRLEGGVAWGNNANDNVLVLVDLKTRQMYDTTMLDDFDYTVDSQADACLLCLNAYNSYTQDTNRWLWSEVEYSTVLSGAELDEAAQLLSARVPEVSAEALPGPDEGQPEYSWEPLPAVAVAELDQRLLSDGELEALQSQSPLQLRQSISTPADARAFLDRRYPGLWMDAMASDGTRSSYLAPWELLEQPEPNVGRFDICNILAWLVEDDLPVGVLYAGTVDEGEEMGPHAGICYIRTEDGIRVFDPVLGMAGDQGSRYQKLNLLPEYTGPSLEDYAAQAMAANPRVWKLYAWEGAARVELDYAQAPRTLDILAPQATLLSHREALDRVQILSAPEDIGEFCLSGYLGGVTLTADQARALVDAEPETVKAQVRTAGDMLLYMLAANITDCFGDKWFFADSGDIWHYNLNAFQVMEQKVANCGASANLANYLLEGDYDEVGFILHGYYPGNGGGHVYNYFLYEGKYYIVDFSWYIFSLYSRESDFPVMVLDRLEDYASGVHRLYGGVCLVLAHTSPGQHLPNIFDDGSLRYAVPEGSVYQILYQSDDPSAYRAAQAPVPGGVPDWRSFGP